MQWYNSIEKKPYKECGVKIRGKKEVSMLDKLTSAVLAVVNAETNGAYKVLEGEEILAALPVRLAANPTSVSNALRYLAERGYIDMRYAEKGTYCVCSLPKGRTYDETVGAERYRGEKAFRNQILYTFLCALLGGLIGGGIVGLLFLLILL